MREFPNNLNWRDFFPMTRGDIKKLQIKKVNNVIVHVFLEELHVILMKPLTIWIAEQIEIFS